MRESPSDDWVKTIQDIVGLLAAKIAGFLSLSRRLKPDVICNFKML